MKSYYGYNLDVLCIQGIRSCRILKEIVTAFKKRIEKHNDDNRMGYSSAIYLEYCPDIETTHHGDDLYWSTSETDDEANYYDKLIISRHSILQTADVQIGTERRSTIKNIDANLMVNYNDSEDVGIIYKYIQIVNLNVDGTYVSLYNVELEDDNIGISNIKERKRQLADLKEIICLNRKRCRSEDMRQFVHGDNTFVACNRDLHIVTGMFHINEIKNGSLNLEYNRLCNLLGGLDTYKWIAALKKDPIPGISNVRFTKDSYTMIVSDPLTRVQDISSKSQKLFEDHKTVIISSNITKNHVDMNQFTNFPEDTVFMVYRPNIELFDNKRFANKKKSRKHYNVRDGNNTTQFMDQVNNVVMTERARQDVKRHPKFGSPKRKKRRRVKAKKEPDHNRRQSDVVNYHTNYYTDSGRSNDSQIPNSRSGSAEAVDLTTTNTNSGRSKYPDDLRISRFISPPTRTKNSSPEKSSRTRPVSRKMFSSIFFNSKQDKHVIPIIDNGMELQPIRRDDKPVKTTSSGNRKSITTVGTVTTMHPVDEENSDTENDSSDDDANQVLEQMMRNMNMNVGDPEAGSQDATTDISNSSWSDSADHAKDRDVLAETPGTKIAEAMIPVPSSPKTE